MAGDIPLGYVYSDVLGWVAPDDPRWERLAESAEVTALRARLQQVEAEAAAMRASLEDIMRRCNGFGPSSPDHEIAHALMVEVPDMAQQALDTTTAGADLLERLRVATDALEEVKIRLHYVGLPSEPRREDGGPDWSGTIATIESVLRRLKGG